MKKNGLSLHFKVKPQGAKRKVAILVDADILERCMMKPCDLLKSGSVFSSEDLSISLDLIKAIAVEMWRLRKRLETAKTAISEKAEINGEPIFDQLQRIKDVLLKYEITTEDHLGESYNDGMSYLRPLHFEEDGSLPNGTMRIVETVKPCVYFKNKLILSGEVIVAKSKEKQEVK